MIVVMSHIEILLNLHFANINPPLCVINVKGFSEILFIVPNVKKWFANNVFLKITSVPNADISSGYRFLN